MTPAPKSVNIPEGALVREVQRMAETRDQSGKNAEKHLKIFLIIPSYIVIAILKSATAHLTFCLYFATLRGYDRCGRAHKRNI